MGEKKGGSQKSSREELTVPEVSRILSKAGADFQCCARHDEAHAVVPCWMIKERASTSACYLAVSASSGTSYIAGNLDLRQGPAEFAESGSGTRWISISHAKFGGSWVRPKVRLGRLMEHLYGPLLR
ncbi:MAG TPA: hypothetical protein GXX30_01055 [Firmicutes bacterium]|nr:hypothetical protein [Candidatus Fermentithermobacillaceae bacterium]